MAASWKTRSWKQTILISPKSTPVRTQAPLYCPSKGPLYVHRMYWWYFYHIFSYPWNFLFLTLENSVWAPPFTSTPHHWTMPTPHHTPFNRYHHQHAFDPPAMDLSCIPLGTKGGSQQRSTMTSCLKALVLQMEGSKIHSHNYCNILNPQHHQTRLWLLPDLHQTCVW